MDEPAPAPPSRLFSDPALLRPFLLAALATALLSGLIVFVSLVSPHPAWRWLPLVAFAAAVEGVYTTHWLSRPERRYLSRPGYRAAELLVIALFLRLLTWAMAGGLPDAETVRGYLLSPLSFFDGLFVIYVAVAALAWERAITWSDLFLRLKLTEAEVSYYSLPASEQAARFGDRPIDRERSHVFTGFVNSWIGGGMWLALATALTSVDTRALAGGGLTTITRLGLQPHMFAALLVYFLLGLWLVSQARLLLMRARWAADGVASPAHMPRIWNRSTLALILLVALVAALLPVGRTFGLAALIQFVLGAVFLVVQLVFFALSALVFLLLGLLGLRAEAPEEVPPEILPAPTPPPPPEAMSETPALILGGLFWVLVAAVSLIALLFFLRDRGFRLETSALGRGWRLLLSRLRALWRRGARQAGNLRAAVAARLQKEEAPAGAETGRSWRFLRVNALPPREQVRYFYLSTVRRAGEQGVAREAGETPSEFATDLKGGWPEAGQEIETLTDAFLEARYSRQPIEAEDVSPIRQVWKRVREALRRQTR
jgi:hypothetical protein